MMNPKLAVQSYKKKITISFASTDIFYIIRSNLESEFGSRRDPDLMVGMDPDSGIFLPLGCDPVDLTLLLLPDHLSVLIN